jgi:hypothetical protein
MASIIHDEQRILVVMVVDVLQDLKVQAHLRIAVVLEPRHLTVVPEVLREDFLEPIYLRIMSAAVRSQSGVIDFMCTSGVWPSN